MKKRLRSLYKKKKENFKPEIKPITENLKYELYQLENKQAKSAKLNANIIWELESEKSPETFFKVLERQNLQNQTISELYTDDNKSKFCSNLKDFSNLQKKIVRHFTPRRQLPKLLLLNFLPKSLTERKYLMNKLTFVRRKYLLMRS